jgi:hypothetical protein
MAFFAIIQRGDLLIPIIKGNDGPDSDCLATWNTLEEAEEGAGAVPMALAFPVLIFDTDNQA